MGCSICGPNPDNPNPLDSCTRRFLQCDNPCGDGDRDADDQPICKELPTQIDTFTTQFFGDGLGKHVDPASNQIVWDLPCGLVSGLAGNPRLPGESLACYFERLFAAGIPGVPGPEGNPGPSGINGADAFTVTEQSFTQPDLSAPYITILTKPVQFIVERLYMIIQGSGVYQILDLEEDGTALLQLLTSFAPVGTNIPSGSIMIVTGFPGIRTLGPRGPKGPPGIPGVVGGQGIVGNPGGQGQQGPTASLFFQSRPTAGHLAVCLNVPNPYTDMGPFGFVWAAPINTPGTFFFAWEISSSVFNGNPATTITGSIKIKVRRHDNNANTDTDIPGTERIVTWESQANLVAAGNIAMIPSQAFLLTFIDTLPSGNFEYHLWASTTLDVSNFQSIVSAGAFNLQGIKLQP